MTHMSNYGNDRLALYTFEAATKFLQCWTNLQFQSISALQLAEKYFRMYPEETEPIWGVRKRLQLYQFSKGVFILMFQTESL
jgi:heparan sulfate N-deacetylase/N-sulfotransferase NDST2